MTSRSVAWKTIETRNIGRGLKPKLCWAKVRGQRNFRPSVLDMLNLKCQWYQSGVEMARSR